MNPQAQARDYGGQLIGGIVSAGFGAGWAVGCGSALAGVSRAIGLVVGAVGVLAGVVLIVLAARLLAHRRRARRLDGETERPPSMFASRGYRVIVAIEVVAIVAAGPVLGAFGLGAYTVIWIAFVVGVHFLGFGRLFWRGFYLIGAVMVLAAVVALVLAVTVTSPVPAVVVATGVSGADLLVAAALAVRDARTLARASSA